MSFIGQYLSRLDAKNRVSLPAGFRHTLKVDEDVRLIVRKDYFENCLVIYPENQWEMEIAKVRSKLNRFDSKQQMVYRKLISEAQDVVLDASGRILLPKQMLEKVGIDQEVLFVGMEQTIEMWAPNVVRQDESQYFMTDSQFADELKDFMTE